MQYQNKQIGSAIIGIMVLVIFVILFTSLGKDNQVIWPVIVILSVVIVLFHSLNIQVNSNTINWSFGPGFWKKSIALNTINAARKVKTKWYYGLGIRYTPSGWLYIVSGTSAVELSLNDGSKVSLGTDDPDNLLKAIEKNCQIEK
ncbi:MAG: hypothetical protein ACPG52_13030 [Cognaticolwellia sp.]